MKTIAKRLKYILSVIRNKYKDIKRKIRIVSHRHNMLKYILTTRCPHCGKFFKFPNISAQGTIYPDEFDNYTLCCKTCKIEEDAYWDAMWEDNNRL